MHVYKPVQALFAAVGGDMIMISRCNPSTSGPRDNSRGQRVLGRSKNFMKTIYWFLLEYSSEKGKEMQYGRSICGPKSTNLLEIHNFEIAPFGIDMIKGNGLMQTKKGMRDISFLAQGKNAKALRPHLQPNKQTKVEVEVRWTGGHAATITAVK